MSIGADTSSPVNHLPVSTVNTVAMHTYSFKPIPYFHAYIPHTYNLYTPILRTKSHFQYQKVCTAQYRYRYRYSCGRQYRVSGIGHLHGIGLTLIHKATKSVALTSDSHMPICLPLINHFHHFFRTRHKPFGGSLQATTATVSNVTATFTVTARNHSSQG